MAFIKENQREERRYDTRDQMFDSWEKDRIGFPIRLKTGPSAARKQ